MKKRKLEDRLFLMSPCTNGVGRFIPYCNFERHRGVVRPNAYQKCERRHCEHYIRLYLSYKNVHDL